MCNTVMSNNKYEIFNKGGNVDIFNTIILQNHYGIINQEGTINVSYSNIWGNEKVIISAYLIPSA